MNIRLPRHIPNTVLWGAMMIYILSSFAISCRAQERDTAITLPPTYLFTGYPNYLITTEPYLRIYAERSIDSGVLSFARIGDIFQLIQPDGEDEFGYAWYEIIYEGNRKGWILTLHPFLVYSFTQAKLLGRLQKKKFVNIYIRNATIQE